MHNIFVVSKVLFTDLGSNPSGVEVFRSLPDRPCSPRQPPILWYCVSFPL